MNKLDARLKRLEDRLPPHRTAARALSILAAHRMPSPATGLTAAKSAGTNSNGARPAPTLLWILEATMTHRDGVRPRARIAPAMPARGRRDHAQP